MDMEDPVIIEKKSSIPSFIMVVWQIILTAAVVMFIMAPEKLENRLVQEDPKPTTVSRKIAPADSSQDKKLTGAQVMQLSDLEDRVVELNQQLVKSEKGRAEQHKTQQAVIEDLTAKINKLESIIASNRSNQGMGGSSGPEYASMTRSPEPASGTEMDSGKPAAKESASGVKVIRKKWSTRKPARIVSLRDEDQGYYTSRGIDSRSPQEEPAAGSGKRTALIESYEQGGGTEAETDYAPPMRYGVNEYQVRSPEAEDAYRTSLRQVYDDTKTSDSKITIYSSSISSYGSW